MMSYGVEKNPHVNGNVVGQKIRSKSAAFDFLDFMEIFYF